MKKIPYGLQNFESIRTENYYYVDKTPFIEKLDNEGAKCLMFLRPRRFGKTLLISTLEHYYDINKADEFDALFKGTYIFDHPTPKKNAYYVFRLDFSSISLDDSLKNTIDGFNVYINSAIKKFYEYYKAKTGGLNAFYQDIHQESNAATQFMQFAMRMELLHIKIILLIDEYDNLANNILTHHGSNTYQDIAHKGGFIRDFFTKIKAASALGVIDRIFMTGVAPMLLSDMTSGFNIASNISLQKKYHNMVGFTQVELEEMLNYYISEGVVQKSDKETILAQCKEYYDNYRFTEDEVSPIYNSNLSIFYLNNYLATEGLPRNLIDQNILTDYGKLRALVINDKHLNGNYSVLTELVSTGETTSNLVDAFPLEAIHDISSFKSLLFYLGLITIKDLDITNQFNFTIPNKTISDVYLNYIAQALSQTFDFSFDKESLSKNITQMITTGDVLPILKTISNTFYSVASLRDFVKQELSLKAYILAYLNFVPYYNVYSEREFNKGFADIYLEAKTQNPKFENFVFLIELKYVKAKEKTPEYILELKENATKQLNQYAIDSYFKDKVLKKVIFILSAEQLEVLEVIK